MALKLMYITKDPAVAAIAEKNGVDRIFIDMEYIGKAKRQGGMDTVQLHHTPEDVHCMRSCLKKAALFVRCNPIHEAADGCTSSAEEIEAVIGAGADIIMLPFFKTAQEVETFLKLVGGRARTSLLLETPEAVACIDEILELPGIDEMFIGLNDLSLGYHKKFMFELLSDGTVEALAAKFHKKRMPFGFGGIAALGQGALPAERIIAEHYRLGSTAVILARSFCNTAKVRDLQEVEKIFAAGVPAIRSWEKQVEDKFSFFRKNMEEIQRITEMMK